MKFSNAKWIFFDVGYTLLDETGAWQERFSLFSRILRERGRDISVERIWQIYRDVCRRFEPMQWLAVVKEIARDKTEEKELAALSKGWRHDLEIPHAGSVEMLRTLSAQYTLGVIANQSLGTSDRLEKHGMRKYIRLVIGSAEAGVTKPDPRIFQLALDQAQCRATDAVMVGDRIDNDIRPAKALGMMTIHVRQGGAGSQVPRNPAEMPDATVPDISDVTDLFNPDGC